MAHITPPPAGELPSTAQLKRASVITLVVAAILTVVVVLPAERAIDVTGIGNLLGLTEMGMIKMEFKAEIAANAARLAEQKTADSIVSAEKAAILAAIASGTKPERTDTTVVALKPGEELPIRLRMRGKAWATYHWKTSAGVVDYDVRGDSAGAADWWYHRYESGSAVAAGDGVLVAKFSGAHGWYWKNIGETALTVTLITSGNYTGIDRPLLPNVR